MKEGGAGRLGALLRFPLSAFFNPSFRLFLLCGYEGLFSYL